MAVKQRNNSDKKPRGKGKPFLKGDPRINRNGRPPVRDAAELNALIDSILAETITDDKGREMDKLSIALNRLLLSKNAAGPIHLLDRRFGKVKEQIDLSNSDGSLATPPLPDEERLSRMKALAVLIANEVKK